MFSNFSGYKSLGCWKDDLLSPAIPTLEGKTELLGEPPSEATQLSPSDAIKRCFNAALSFGFNMFAIQNGRYCSSSATGLKTYQKYGVATTCMDDGGGLNLWNFWNVLNQVYEVEYGKPMLFVYQSKTKM